MRNDKFVFSIMDFLNIVHKHISSVLSYMIFLWDVI